MSIFLLSSLKWDTLIMVLRQHWWTHWCLLLFADPSHLSAGVMWRGRTMCQKENRPLTLEGGSAVQGQCHIVTAS